MKTNLEKLASNLGAENCKEPKCTKPGHLWRIDDNRCFAHPENFKITSKHVSKEMLEIYLRKGVYPYEYMDSWTKFEKTCLPPKEAFYSKLNNTYILDKKYEYALGIGIDSKIENRFSNRLIAINRFARFDSEIRFSNRF